MVKTAAEKPFPCAFHVHGCTSRYAKDGKPKESHETGCPYNPLNAKTPNETEVSDDQEKVFSSAKKLTKEEQDELLSELKTVREKNKVLMKENVILKEQLANAVEENEDLYAKNEDLFEKFVKARDEPAKIKTDASVDARLKALENLAINFTDTGSVNEFGGTASVAGSTVSSVSRFGASSNTKKDLIPYGEINIGKGSDDKFVLVYQGNSGGIYYQDESGKTVYITNNTNKLDKVAPNPDHPAHKK